jgi:hypothetical protein
MLELLFYDVVMLLLFVWFIMIAEIVEPSKTNKTGLGHQ